MTRLLLTLAVASVWAVVTGCSARDQSALGLHIVRPATGGDADAARESSGELPSYEPLAGLSGEIVSIGASTATNLVARVAVRFRQMYPNVTFQLTASRTIIGPAALVDGRADIVPMSRPLDPAEIRVFASKFGYAPTEIKVAADALAIFVEKTNPVSGLTLDQLDGIFGRTQHRGGSSIETWGQLGLIREWTDRPIILYGYGPDDGAHRLFQAQVLEGAGFVCRCGWSEEGHRSCKALPRFQGLSGMPAFFSRASECGRCR